MQIDKIFITSAYKLSQAEKVAILQSLGLDDKRIEVENRVDEKIVAGLIIKFAGYYFDYSIKSKLEEIVESLDI